MSRCAFKASLGLGTYFCLILTFYGTKKEQLLRTILNTVKPLFNESLGDWFFLY
jgi:hypothetical protein